MSWDGKVTENFTDRLQRAARNGTGYLELHDAARERRGWVFLEDQDVVAILVDGYQPRLARRLTASEFVSVADMGDVLAVTTDDYDPRIAVECVARGLVDAVTMKVLYREFMLSAASFVDEWELGDSQWVSGVPPWEGRSTAVPVPLLVSAMNRRKEHWARLWAGLSTATIPDRVPVRTGSSGYQPETPDEAAVLWAVNGRRTVDQVAGECGFTRFQAGNLMAALMAKKVLDLFPVNDPQSTTNVIRVEAGYYAASEAIPDENVPAEDVETGGRPLAEVVPRRPWVVPMASDPRPPGVHPDSTHETTQVAVAGPVAADDPEGNVVTQHIEVEDAGGVVGSGHAPGVSGSVAADRTGARADEAQLVVPAAQQVAPTNETVGEVNGEPDVGTGASHRGGPAERSQPATNPSQFFVSSVPPPAAVQDRPPVRAAQQHDLPPLPAITGGPSDFYAVLPSTLPRRPGGVIVTALPELPLAPAAAHKAAHEAELLVAQEAAHEAELLVAHEAAHEAAQEAAHEAELFAAHEAAHEAELLAAHEAELAAEHEAAREPVADPPTPGEMARAEQKPELDPDREAADVLDAELDMEVTRLRDELMHLARERKAAVEQAAVLYEQAELHSAHADAAAILVEEADRSIARLTRVTSDASATAVNQFEWLLLARHEDARVAALRAQVDQDAEKAGKALEQGQHDFDESSAVHANLEHDLQVEVADRETVLEAWRAATDGAGRSTANARHAEAAAAKCGQLLDEARERLTEMANADW